MTQIPTKNEFHITIQIDGKTAIDHLTEASKLSRQTIKQAMQKGCVWLESDNYTQRLRRVKKVLKEGSTLHFYYDEKVLMTHPEEAHLLFDKGAFSIWNKPSGMLSQGSKWGDHCTIYRWAEQHLQPERPAFLVHRLDRAASGLIIIAHKKKTAAKFSEMFKKHEIEKHYQVWVEGDFSKHISAEEPIKIITEKIDGKDAESHVFLLEFDKEKNRSLLDVEIKTGRKHQIRIHLANISYPVVGDRLYGSGKSKEDLQLKAVTLFFNCPETGTEKKYSLPEIESPNKKPA